MKSNQGSPFTLLLYINGFFAIKAKSYLIRHAPKIYKLRNQSLGSRRLESNFLLYQYSFLLVFWTAFVLEFWGLWRENGLGMEDKGPQSALAIIRPFSIPLHVLSARLILFSSRKKATKVFTKP